MYRCVVPPQAQPLAGNIWSILAAAKFDPEPLDEAASVTLTDDELSALCGQLPESPMCSGEAGHSFTVITLRGNKTPTEVRSVLSSIVEYSGRTPKWEGGTRKRREVSGANLRLRQLVFIPVTDEEKKICEVFDPSPSEAAAA